VRALRKGKLVWEGEITTKEMGGSSARVFGKEAKKRKRTHLGS